MQLEAATDGEIVADNILAVQAIYFSYMLEELRAFQVVDRLAQLFSQGLLPIGRQKTKETLLGIAFRKERLTEQDRRSLYARALGATNGEAGSVEPNREFLSLWLRFLVALAAYAEQHGAETVLAPPSPANAAVRGAARALAANASAHGGGLTRQMAVKLLAEVHAAIDLLGSRDVLHVYGARDAWQVIDLVSRNDLGGARNVLRFRTQATAGSLVLRWLAEHGDLLDDANAAAHATTPDGAELVDAAGQMLLVSSAQASADPQPPRAEADVPAMVRRPELQRAAHDLLDATGLGPGSRPADGASATSERGAIAVFHGDRHTGKTLAAYELAQALGKPVYRIDLARVISKYAGETEKNLDAVLGRALQADSVLLIDEADALFGQRSEVRDAHDRYANLDVAQLLQRVQAHAGPVILATNLRHDVDAAFMRRLRFVSFPRPLR